jgi:general secretion pathway protein J
MNVTGSPLSRGRRPIHRAAGFTLLELTIALVLLALMAGVLYGALGFAGTATDKGEAKVDANAGMRLAQDFLRGQIETQHPLRLRKVAEFPLLFAGEQDQLRYAAPLPSRVASGGVWYFRLSVARDDPRSPLLLERVVPDVNAARPPEFTADAERSVLALGIADIKIGYFGRDSGAINADDPTWRDRWDNAQRVPLLVRIDVTPKQGPPWPTLIVAPREAPEAGCRAYDPTRQICAGV